MEESVRLNKIIVDVKFNLTETLTRLEDIWANIGLKEQQKDERYETINRHIHDLLHEMLSEEYALEAKLQVKINEYEKELEQLCSDLCEELPTRDDNVKLVEMEATLRNNVVTLNKKKCDRMKWLRSLRDDEILLCEFLGMPQVDISFLGCPTEDQLCELELHIAFLKKERVIRSESFEKLRRGITSLWSQMDIGPDNESEYELLSGNVNSVSKDYLEDLAALHVKLNEDYVEILKDIDVKRQIFISLWSTLKDQINISDVPVQDVPTENDIHTLRILNSNIDQLNAVTKEHLKQIITAVQNELAIVWDKCFFGENQRKCCLSSYQGEYTEQSLEYHKSQLSTMKEHFEANKDLFKLIAKREVLWKEKMELERNPADYLLNTRGGASLKALNRKNRIANTLPKLEIELQNRIKVWELQNNKCFIFRDMPYNEHIKELKEEYEREEKQKKDMREEVKRKGLDSGKNQKRKALAHSSNHTPLKQKIACVGGNSMKKSNASVVENNQKIIHPSSSMLTHAKRPTPRAKLDRNTPVGFNKTQAKTKVNTFTHSSLKNNNENQLKRKKVLEVKLSTEWTKKQHRNRRSIAKGGGVLKEKSMNFKMQSQIDEPDCGLIFSDNEFSDSIELDHVQLRSSSLTSRDSLSDSPGLSVISDDDVKIVVHCK